MLKDFVFLLFFGLTCTFAYQAVEEERFFEQYLLSAFVIMQVSHVAIQVMSGAAMTLPGITLGRAFLNK